MPTEKAAALCLSLARFLFNGLNYQGLFAPCPRTNFLSSVSLSLAPHRRVSVLFPAIY